MRTKIFNPEDDEHVKNAGKNEELVKEKFWPKLKKISAEVPFVLESVAMYYAARDPKVPMHAKAVALGALAYVILPLDLVPDFIAGLGYVDDAAAVFAAYKAISEHVTDEHHEKAKLKMLGL